MKTPILTRLAILSFAFHLGISSATAESWEITIEPRPEDAQGKSLYRLWLPAGVKHVRGVIFRQHGCGPGARKLGLEHADDIQWQALARKWDCALMGSQIWAPDEDCTTWFIPQDGSAHAFLTALTRFAKLSGHAEIEHVPWCLWGHSGGAVWVMNMVYRYPTRVVAAFPRSGGLSPIGREYTRGRPAEPDGNPAALAVPILFCHGDQEAVETSRFIKGVRGAYKIYDYGRSRDAVWGMAVHPDSGHENSNSRLLAIRFFDAVMAQRLPPAAATKPVLPKPVVRKNAWLGDLKTHSIQPVADPLGNPLDMAWLPDKATAEAWREWSQQGDIFDKSPPPAPTAVALEVSDQAVVITWQAQADIESGISRFLIHRDGKQLAELGGPVDKRWNPQGHYHAWNYSDQPLRGVELPPLRYEDRSPGRSATAEYQVTTLNKSGIGSPRSKPAKAKLAPDKVDLFVAGQGGYHTYRIPAMVVSPKGHVLVFCEGRKTSRSDDGDIDMLLRRSTDGGKTWQPAELLYEEDGDAPTKFGNPCPLVDRETRTVWLTMNRSYGADRTKRSGGDIIVMSSRDDGRTWSKPVDITKQVKRAEWRHYAQGPGVGIQLTRGPHRGRLIVPANYRTSFNNRDPSYSHIMVSDDHGKTWSLGGIVGPHTNECQLAEIVENQKPGLLFNMRNHWGRAGKPELAGKRLISRSFDAGGTWSEAAVDKTLIEPTCQASLLRYSWPAADAKSVLLFANPASPRRDNLTVRISYDEGRTWPVKKTIETGSSAYSCLTRLADGRVGLIYERDDYRKLTFVAFTMDWLEKD